MSYSECGKLLPVRLNMSLTTPKKTRHRNLDLGRTTKETNTVLFPDVQSKVL